MHSNAHRGFQHQGHAYLQPVTGRGKGKSREGQPIPTQGGVLLRDTFAQETHYTGWDFLRTVLRSEKPYLPSPSSPLSSLFHRCQTYTVVWRPSLSTTAPFPPSYLSSWAFSPSRVLISLTPAWLLLRGSEMTHSSVHHVWFIKQFGILASRWQINWRLPRSSPHEGFWQQSWAPQKVCYGWWSMSAVAQRRMGMHTCHVFVCHEQRG